MDYIHDGQILISSYIDFTANILGFVFNNVCVNFFFDISFSPRQLIFLKNTLKVFMANKMFNENLA